MKNSRLLMTILLTLSIIVLPKWIYVPALILAIAAIPLFWEAVFLGFLVDVLYGPASSIFFSAGLLTLAGLLILIPLRERIRTYA